MSRNSKLKRDKRKKREQEAQADSKNQRKSHHLATIFPSGDRTTTASIPTEKYGPPGIPHELHIVVGHHPSDPNDHTPFQRAMEDSEERDFTIIAHLAKEPGKFSQDLKISATTFDGASLIQAPPDAHLIAIETTFGRIKVHSNPQRELSALQINGKTKNGREAFALYSNALAPLVDHISFHHNVPIFVSHVVLWDQKHETITASYTAPHPHVGLSGSTTTFDLKLTPHYALYREALTNPSVFYQFLCYSKILEGIFKYTYPALVNEARSRNSAIPRLDARVEDHPEITGPVRRWVGKGIQQTFTEYLQPEFRNAIAHFTDDHESPLVVSNYITGASVANNLLLARMCARGAIHAIERILTELQSAASSPG